MKTKRALLAALLAIPAAPAMAQTINNYTPCVDYYALGESPCNAPAVPTPTIIIQQNAASTQASTPLPPKSEVDQYLENYGKPPREFVEFYLNPTPENAMKWVSTYNSLIQRGQALSRTWDQADKLYEAAQNQGVNPLALVSSTAPAPAAIPSATVPGVDNLTLAAEKGAAQLATVNAGFGAPSKAVHIGAFASVPDSALPDAPVHLTYYFSATCPYCAKMTPELANIFNDMKGKLTLTCVDVTPLSATQRPRPENIAGKLPCAWRVPNEGEVESIPVQQTPTMIITRANAKPIRLSGFIPTTTMMLYLTGAPQPPAGASTMPVITRPM